ncbi:Ufm1-specific protease 2 [Trichinella zimbabwensis]|uniref:Ufm1-specific protease n=1 Tax=Trichinella zimbabwensis TaxID=268475 RepID=A0A0V1HEL1_9BILA|nr:Ufm1-specific protease 2 [Trichinella zimbabwensis]
MQLKVYESYFKETARYIEHHGGLATHGILLGSVFNDAVIIYRALLFKNEVDVYSELGSIWNSLAGGVDIVGVLILETAEQKLHDSHSIISKYLHFIREKFIPETAEHSVVAKHSSSSVDMPNFFAVTNPGSIEVNINLEPVIPQWITAREIQSQLITLKSSLKLQAQIALDVHNSKVNVEKCTMKAFDHLIRNMKQDSNVFIHGPSGSILGTTAKNSFLNGLKANSTVGDLRTLDENMNGGKSRSLNSMIHAKVIQLSHGKLFTPDLSDDNKFALIADSQNRNYKVYSIPIHLEPVICLQSEVEVNEIHINFEIAIIRLLEQAKQCLLKNCNFESLEFPIPEFTLLLPPPALFFITVCQPRNTSDSDNLEWRNDLHARWNLSTFRSIFRRMNRFVFSDDLKSRLRNVHEALTSPGDESNMATVHGLYEYYHYMQDNFDDRGWGCAYRSFQTIWSWFMLNGYTEKPVPNHRQIQQALADVGDKPKSFVGTKQWIGSMELSYCIDHLLGITCRTLSLNSREELTDWAEELRRHFHSAGTPVMIGGGNLAHTILGVSINEATGEAKYLVLDPHYTGAEDLKSITQKGWCGWKTVDFWSSGSFYNLLLPLLPDQH